MSSSPSSAFWDTIVSARARLGMIQISNRTPNRGTATNAADCVERQMRADAHSTWGFVIYRCTYKDDEKWKDFQERLGFWVYTTLESHEGLDMRASLDIQIHEDPDYEEATPETIQGYFMNWIRQYGRQEHGQLGLSQRYRYCIHIDQEALDSIVKQPQPPQDVFGDGYVNLVRVPADYIEFVESGGADALWDAQGREEAAEPKDLELNWLEDDEEEEEDADEPVEGWDDAICMRIPYTSLMVDAYGRFRAKVSWRREYCVPPEVGHRSSIYDTSSLTPKE